MHAKLQTITMPVTILQGSKDKLVHPGNADYAEQTMRAAQLRVRRFADAGHFLIWEQPDMVVAEIQHLLQLARPLEQN